MSEIYKIQVNDSEPIEVSQQVYEVSFCFNEMLKEKDNEIERLNNIINKLEEVLNENVELTYVHYGRRQYNKTLTEGGLLFRDYIKSKLQELKGSGSNDNI